VVCGYHYLTDTIGGVLLGTALVCIGAQLARSHERHPATPV